MDTSSPAATVVAPERKGIEVGREVGTTEQVSLATQKSVAKMGMISSLGGLLVSGFFRFQGARALHLTSGWAFLCFTLWHWMLNQPRSRGKTPGHR
jgi:hypothetical protein